MAEPVTVRTSVTLINKNGLHARPAHLFVQTANKFSAALLVGRQGVESVNGKSIMGIMMLAAECGTTLELVSEGADASEQIAALRELIDSKFGE
jgi:phosphocarrier protein HPr